MELTLSNPIVYYTVFGIVAFIIAYLMDRPTIKKRNKQK